ncbi:Histone-lysine N-methyltransferase SETMAR [Eumeta japonica]|uniref:Histone-lysine N-methyltransferase SETMAR n=1 Tax=Eumeta variegata TaxID=151549 RepID=A0A4C1UTM5_EUMVA|nr:Histone-lysine N-methyltransferase SETMAR [Eumeta japonica]
MRHKPPKKNHTVYEPKAVSLRVAQNWFKCFQSGNFDFKDEPRSGRPVTDKIDNILKKVEQNRHITSYDIAEELSIDQKIILTNLKKAEYTKKFDTWGPTRDFNYSTIEECPQSFRTLSAPRRSSTSRGPLTTAVTNEVTTSKTRRPLSQMSVVNSTIEPTEKKVAQSLAFGDVSSHRTHYYLWTVYIYSVAWCPVATPYTLLHFD